MPRDAPRCPLRTRGRNQAGTRRNERIVYFFFLRPLAPPRRIRRIRPSPARTAPPGPSCVCYFFTDKTLRCVSNDKICFHAGFQSMAEKAVWDEANVVHFIAICKQEVSNGNRPLGFLNTTGWKNLVEKFEAKSGKKITKIQLKNKWDNMKKEYTWFMELKNAATGLGWDDTKQTVDASKEWWAEHIQRCNNPEKGIKCNHMRYRKHGPKHLDDLPAMFDKIHVTGATATCPGDISSDESIDEDVDVVNKTDEKPEVKLDSLKKTKENKKRKESSNATGEKDEKRPFFRLYKNTCQKIGTAADKISSSVATSTNNVPSIADVMQMVKDCVVEEGTGLMHTATTMIMKPEFREIFGLLKTKEGRFDLLVREYEN